MLATSSCPNRAQLESLIRGQLPAAEFDGLVEHLSKCSACTEVIQRLDAADTLVENLRSISTLSGDIEENVVRQLIERLSKLAGSPPSTNSPPQVVTACPACTKKLSIAAENVGKKVRCPKCGGVFAATPSQQAADRASQTLATVGGEQSAGNPTFATTEESEKELCACLAPAQQADELGRLGPYRVLQVLGAGGMGVVYKAEDPQLQRLVALKAMLPSLGASASARQRFLREARAAAAIKHDHIVTIHQVAEDRGIPYLAMEFLDGESLEQRLHRETKLPVHEAVRIGRDVAEGLAAAHERDLVHRDIKPANIWLETRDERRGARGKSAVSRPSSFVPRVKILDFGLARSSGENTQLTQQGAIIGTPGYMAPEQAQGDKVNFRCDLFSLGCVLYRMTTGQQPFQGADTISTLMAVVLNDPMPPEKLNAEITAPLSRLILQLIAKKPGERPQSAADVTALLEEIEHELPAPQPRHSSSSQRTVEAKSSLTEASADRTAAPASQTRHQDRSKNRKPYVIAAAVLFSAALLTAIIVLRFSGDAEGILTIETIDPNVEVIVRQGGKEVAILDKKTRTEAKLPVGVYTFALRGGKDGLKLETNQYTLKSGDREVVRVTWSEQAPQNPKVQAKSAPPVIEVLTSHGDFKFELDSHLAPKTVARFLQLVAEKAYDGTTVDNGSIGNRKNSIPAGPDQPYAFRVKCGDADGTRLNWLDAAPTTGAFERGDVCLDQRGGDNRGFHICMGEGKQPGIYVLGRIIDGMPILDHLSEGEYRQVNGKREVWLRLKNEKVSIKTVRQANTAGPSLLAALSKDRISKDELFPWQPAELVAVIGQHRPDSLKKYLLGAFAPDASALAVISDQNVELLDVSTLSPRATLSGHKRPINCVAYSPDGTMLATGSEDNIVGLWDVRGGAKRHDLNGHNLPITSVAFTPNSQMLISATGKYGPRIPHEELKCWDLKSGQPLWSKTPPQGNLSIAISPDGASLAVAHGGGTGVFGGIAIHEIKDGAKISDISTLRRRFRSIHFTPDGVDLITTGADAASGGPPELLVWFATKPNPPGGLPRKAFTGFKGVVLNSSFSQDGYLASAHQDGIVIVWDYISGKKFKEWTFPDPVDRVLFAPDGKHLAVGSATGVIYICRLNFKQPSK